MQLLITKAIIKSINAAGTRCTVEIPLFKSASMTQPVEATALINIAPGIYNNLSVGVPLTAEMLEKVQSYANVVSVTKNIDSYPPDYPDSDATIFPFSTDFWWTRDNFGPLWIPAKGAEVELTIENLPLYQRIITSYEGNELEIRDGKIFINSEEAQSYTFQQDYYFMMGDNRHNSLDSRYWGFVPEDHIVGKPALVWLSIDGNRKFPNNIRWRRFFKFV